jgi:hypothetical protein
MKSFLMLAAAALTFAGVPFEASAKERGCEYRLNGLRDAKIALFQVVKAGKKGDELDHAKAQVQRAEERAREEGCFDRRIVIVDERDRFDRGRDRFDRDRYYRDRNHNGYPDRIDRRDERALRNRMEELEYLARRRGLSRAEYNELQALRRRLH